MTETNVVSEGFDTRSIEMQPVWLIMFKALVKTLTASRVIEAIYEIHSYYEPVTTLTDVSLSPCKGLDGKNNPQRWWNKKEDWKNS